MSTVFIASLCLLAAANPSDDAFRAGLLALQSGDLTGAQSNLETASKLAPRDGRVWVALSQAYWRLHKNAQAEEAAGKAATIAPDDTAVLKSLVIYYSETSQPLKAARASAKYAAKAPGDDALERAAELYFQAAKPLLDQAKFTEAVAVVEEAVAQQPKSAQLQLALGVTYYGLRRFDDAADAFLRTIEIAPETEQPYLFLGRILDQIPTRLPQATQRFTDYETAHPNSPTGYLLHAKGLDAQSLDPELALRFLEKSNALNPNDASTYFEKGTVLDRLQRFSEAAAEFERAAELQPSDPAVHYRLARDYDRAGKHDAAKAEREKHARLVAAQEVNR